MWDNIDKVKEYFFNTKNVGVLADADATGEVDHVLAVMPAIVDKRRGISPFRAKEGAPQAFDPAYA